MGCFGEVQPTKAQPSKYLWAYAVPATFLPFLALGVAFSSIPARQSATFGSRTYLVLGITSGVQGVLTFLCQPAVGAWSDVVGRKWALFASIVSTGLPVFMLAFTQSMWVYQILYGLSGFVNASYSLGFAYVTDVTLPSGRAFALAAVACTFGAAFTVGPLASIPVVHHFGQHAAFIAGAALVVLSLLYTAILVPESVAYAKGRSRSTRASRVSLDLDLNGDSWGGLDKHLGRAPPRRHCCSSQSQEVERLNPFRIFGILAHKPLLRHLAVIAFLASTAEQAIVSLVIPYCQHRFKFSPTTVAYMAAVMGGSTVFTQLGLFQVLVRRIGPQYLLVGSLLVSAAHIMLYAFATTGWVAFLAIFFAPGAYFVPLTIAYIASRVMPKEEQGAVQGALQGVRSLTNGIGPAVFGVLLDFTVNSSELPSAFKGSAFLVGALAVLIAAGLALCLPPIVHCADDDAEAAHERAMQGGEEPSAALNNFSATTESPLLRSPGGGDVSAAIAIERGGYGRGLGSRPTSDGHVHGESPPLSSSVGSPPVASSSYHSTGRHGRKKRRASRRTVSGDALSRQTRMLHDGPSTASGMVLPGPDDESTCF